MATKEQEAYLRSLELCNITEWTNVYRADTGAQIPRP